jgi:hypothetical protein
MLLGAGLWSTTSNADLDLALANGRIGEYLEAAGQYQTALVSNLLAWIVGALALGVAGTAMAGLAGGAGLIRDLVRFIYAVGAAIATSAFVAWLAIVVQLPGDIGPTEIAIAEVVGWYAYRLDSVATVLLVGVGPALVSWSGRETWVPRWLFGWGNLAALVGFSSFLPYFVPSIPLSFGLLIVPVGIGWTVAAGIVLLRSRPQGSGEK